MAKRPMLPPQLAGPPSARWFPARSSYRPGPKSGLPARPFRQERFPIAGSHVIEKEWLNVEESRHAEIENPGQAF